MNIFLVDKHSHIRYRHLW